MLLRVNINIIDINQVQSHPKLFFYSERLGDRNRIRLKNSVMLNGSGQSIQLKVNVVTTKNCIPLRMLKDQIKMQSIAENAGT